MPSHHSGLLVSEVSALPAFLDFGGSDFDFSFWVLLLLTFCFCFCFFVVVFVLFFFSSLLFSFCLSPLFFSHLFLFFKNRSAIYKCTFFPLFSLPGVTKFLNLHIAANIPWERQQLYSLLSCGSLGCKASYCQKLAVTQPPQC